MIVEPNEPDRDFSAVVAIVFVCGERPLYILDTGFVLEPCAGGGFSGSADFWAEVEKVSSQAGGDRWKISLWAVDGIVKVITKAL